MPMNLLKDTRILSHVQRLILVGLTLLLTIGCDQTSKSVAIETLKGEAPRHFFGGVFRLQYIENPGAFLGLGGSLPESVRFWILNVVVGIAMGVMLFTLVKKPMQAYLAFAFSLIAGGGLSNLIDRMFRTEGHVVDFLNVGVGPVRTGIFNVADVAIMVGATLLIFATFKFSPDSTRNA